MSFEPFDEFVRVSPVPDSVIRQYEGSVEDAVVDMWKNFGYGMTAGGFLKVVDPNLYLEMIGEFLPRKDMIPIFATAMGDIVVAFSGKYRNLQFRYARARGSVGSSIDFLAPMLADPGFRHEMFDSEPYEQAATTYGPLTSPDDLDYIYAYKLPLPAGGPEGVEYLTRSRIFEHIAFTAQLAGPIPFAG